MEQNLVYLAQFVTIVVLFLLAFLLSLASKRLKIANILLLVAAGLILARLKLQGAPLVSIQPILLSFLATIILIWAIFHSTANLRLKHLDTLAVKTIRFVFISLLLCLVFLTIGVSLLFGVKSMVMALVFSLLMAATAFESYRRENERTSEGTAEEALRIESHLTNPLVFLLAFVLIDAMLVVAGPVTMQNFVWEASPFIQRTILGLGAGIVIGLIVFKLMRDRYSKNSSFILMIVAAILTYKLAEMANGNGFLAVIMFGFLFGHVYIKEKKILFRISAAWLHYLLALTLILAFLVIGIPLSAGFFLKSLLLFVVYLAVRYLAIHLSFKSEFCTRERLYMTMNSSKGTTTAVIVLAIFTLGMGTKNMYLSLSLAFIIYSAVLSLLCIKFSGLFFEGRYQAKNRARKK